jgi:hypothetical protein
MPNPSIIIKVVGVLFMKNLLSWNRSSIRKTGAKGQKRGAFPFLSDSPVSGCQKNMERRDEVPSLP